MFNIVGHLVLCSYHVRIANADILSNATLLVYFHVFEPYHSSLTKLDNMDCREIEVRIFGNVQYQHMKMTVLTHSYMLVVLWCW